MRSGTTEGLSDYCEVVTHCTFGYPGDGNPCFLNQATSKSVKRESTKTGNQAT